MPKKFHGENSKSAEARARKEQVAETKRVQKEKEIEDKLWAETDKNVLKKMERKDDREKKQQEALQKKQERDKLLEEEMRSIKGAKSVPSKVTRSDISSQSQAEKDQRDKLAAEKPKDKTLAVEEPLEENVNRMVMEGHHARNVEDALAILKVGNAPVDVEKHPEKRMKAAYAAFEEREMERLKQEYPNFRLSQLKQMLKKEWTKAPENPFNQPSKQYNAKDVRQEENDSE